MTQIKTKIPAELEPAAVGGMVTDSKYVKDRVKNKTQEEVNADTEERVSTLEESVGTGGSVDERIAEEGAKHYLKTETYNKTELNNMITTPNQEYVSVTATDQTTAVTDVLPASGEADTVYRVGNWDGSQYDTTCYTEYAWNGSAYVLLNTKEYGIDDKPTDGSENLIKSGGVYSELNPYRQIVFTPISKKGSGQYRSLTSASIVDTYASGYTADYYEVQAGNTYKISGSSSIIDGSLMMVYFATALNYNTPTISIKTFTTGEFSVEYTPESDGYIFVQVIVSSNTVLTSTSVQVEGYGELINFREDYDAKIGNLSSLDDILTKTSIVNSINSLFNIYKPYLAYQYFPVPKKETKSINCVNNGGTGTIDIYAANCSADCYEIQTGKKYKVSCTGSADDGGLMMIYTAVNLNYGAAATCIATFLEGSVVREFTSNIDGYVIVQVRRGDSYTTTNISVEVSEQIADVVDFQEQIDEIGTSVEDINETISKDEKILAYTPKIVNRIPNFEREEFRVLMIGNSYDGDYTSVLRYMCSSAGIDISKICIYFMMRSAGTFKMWYDIYNNQADGTYTIYKPLGELSTQSQNCIYAVDSNDDSVDDRIGVQVQGTNGGLFRDILSKNRWDIVFIHQDTRVATSYDWEGHDDKGYLNELVRIVRTNCPKACVGTIINHAGYSNAVSAGQTTEERFNLIANAVKMFQKDYGLDMIVPCGTAVENIRKSTLNTTTMGFSYDGHHLGIGIGQYAANAALFESIIAPRYGISVLGNSLRVSVVPGQVGYENGESLPVTDDNASTVQMAAILAVNDMYKVQNPDGVIL